MIVDQAGHQRAAAACDDACVRPAVDRDWLRLRFVSILLPRTRTLEGAESVALLPSKMRTFSNNVTAPPASAALRADGGRQSDSHDQKRGNEGASGHPGHQSPRRRRAGGSDYEASLSKPRRRRHPAARRLDPRIRLSIRLRKRLICRQSGIHARLRRPSRQPPATAPARPDAGPSRAPSASPSASARTRDAR